VVITKVITLLNKAALVCERMPVRFCNEANTYGIPVVPVWSCSVFNFLQGWCNLFLKNDIAFLQL